MKITVNIEVESADELDSVAKALKGIGTKTASVAHDLSESVAEPVSAEVEDVPVIKEKAPKKAKAPKAAKPVVEAPAPEIVPPTPEAEEFEEVPSPFVAQAAAAPIAPSFDRAGTIAKIQETVQILVSKIADQAAQRTFITECFAIAQVTPAPMTTLPDEQMQKVFPVFYNRVMGLVNGNVTGALV